MPSDNLYSDPDSAVPEAHDDDAATASALSPSDGYFRDQDSATVSPTSHHHTHHHQPSNASRRSGSTPYVPNILVEDPTLTKDPDSKAQIAQRLINRDVAVGVHVPPSSSTHPHHNPESYYYTSASPSGSGASPDTPSTYTNTSYPSAQSSHYRSGLQDAAFQQQRQLHVNTSPQHPSNYNTHPYNGRGDAPPAYIPSSPENNPNNCRYSTFPSSTPRRMGLPEEQDRLLSPEEQSAVSDPPKQPLWRRIRDSHDSGSLRQKIKKILGILVFVSIILVFMGVNMSGPSYRNRIIDKSAIRIPDMDESKLVWHPGRSCRDTPHTYPKETFHASLSSDRVLFIEQTMHRKDWTDPSRPTPNVNGQVILRPTTSGKAEIDVEIIANYKELDIQVEFSNDGGTDHVKVTTPRVVPDTSSRDVCIQIRITVWVPLKALINTLSVSTVSLNVLVQEGLTLGAENEIDISTIAGNIVFPADDSDVEPYKMKSPRYKYLTVSGDVKGWFPMYHRLRIDTVSGDVSAQITHKDVVLESSESCLLNVSSISGVLKINDGSQDMEMSGAGIPPRDYLVKVVTISGDVTANLAIGSSSEFFSASGDVELNLVPVLDERWLQSHWRPLLRTESTSGAHRVQVSEPHFVSIPDKLNPHERPTLPKDRKSEEKNSVAETEQQEEEHEDREMKRQSVAEKKRGLVAFDSRHSSISGNLQLSYPASWEGTFSADTISSSIAIYGKDVIVDKNKGGFIGMTISGHKGDGASKLEIDEMSGNIVLSIGQD
ncbi:hypothetical protein MY11210_005841 [Beauveria gryllotalpidicola]